MDIKEIPCLYQVADLFLDTEINQEAIQEATHQVLKAIGENPEREGLLRTPERVSKMYGELLAGYRTDP